MQRKQLKPSGGVQTLHMSIDPGSYKMGVAFFDPDGKFICSTLLKAREKDPAARRLSTIRQKFDAYFAETFGDAYITITVMEHLPPSQITPSLPISAGSIVSMHRNVSRLTPECAIGVGSWKSVAKQLGCTMRDPKGLPAFNQIPWEFQKPGCEDEADAVFIYLAYSWNHHGFAWLGPNLKVKKVATIPTMKEKKK